jgi:tRNA-i(6)A37 thiotransferase enzyme MiaB
LDELVAALLELPGLERLRLSSLHPRDLTDRLLGVLASSPRAMPQIHLPLQSGSDAVLRAMRRGYTVRQYLEAVERTRRWLDEPAFTTDIIVGFPGETEEDFDATLNVARQVGFSRIHMYPFAPRPGTPAATAPDPVPPAVVKERMRSLKNWRQTLRDAPTSHGVGGQCAC